MLRVIGAGDRHRLGPVDVDGAGEVADDFAVGAPHENAIRRQGSAPMNLCGRCRQLIPTSAPGREDHVSIDCRCVFGVGVGIERKRTVGEAEDCAPVCGPVKVGQLVGHGHRHRQAVLGNISQPDAEGGCIAVVGQSLFDPGSVDHG